MGGSQSSGAPGGRDGAARGQEACEWAPELGKARPAPHGPFRLMKRASALPGSSLPSSGSPCRLWSRRGTCPRFSCSLRRRAAVGQQGSWRVAGLGSPGTEPPAQLSPAGAQGHDHLSLSPGCISSPTGLERVGELGGRAEWSDLCKPCPGGMTP